MWFRLICGTPRLRQAQHRFPARIPQRTAQINSNDFNKITRQKNVFPHSFPIFYITHSPAPGARAEAVYSANIVGYTKINTLSGLTIIGSQFQAVGGEGTSIAVQAINTVGFIENDSLQFWNGSSYDFIYYYDDIFEDDINWKPLGPGWGDGDQLPAVYPVDAGRSFWTKSANGGSVVISGEVGTNTVISFSAGLSLIINPMPVALPMWTLVSGFPEQAVCNVKAVGLKENDSLQFWNGSSYDFIYYYDDIFEDDVNWEPLGPGWGDGDQLPVDFVLPLGKGFWLKSSASGTLTFANPQIQ